MRHPVLTLEIRFEHDVVQARQRARQIAQLLGFEHQEQTRIATAVSEIARNAFQYAGGGKIEFSIRFDDGVSSRQSFVVQIEDRGPGISDLKEILEGRYTSRTGMGQGIVGAMRLMDHFAIESTPEKGTRIQLWKEFPEKLSRLQPNQLVKVADALARRQPESPLEEIQRQNEELLRMMEIIKAREAELAKANEALKNTNQELEETNRGVVALYTELDEKAADLKQANEIKTRFLSYMSHEFRTPISSIISLSRIVLDRLDGDLTPEQEKQIGFMNRAAQDVLEMVNDLLDLSKAEAGRVEVQPKRFLLTDVFGTLKGLMRPLLANPSVDLIFEGAEDIPELYTDEGKLAQILRNLISNALKFTERGEIRVSAETNPEGQFTLKVADTGIGIRPEDQERVFEEYSQIDSLLQKKVKGTGLGLTLVRKFTELLGGRLSLESEPGIGSIFSVTLPLEFSAVAPSESSPSVIQALDPGSIETERSDVILIIDDEVVSRYLLRGLLAETGCRVVEAANGQEGIRLASEEKPSLIFLDFVMPEMGAFEVIDALQADPNLREIPVVVRTSKVLTPQERNRLMKNALAILSKETSSRGAALAEIRHVLAMPRRVKEGDSRKEPNDAA